VLFPPSKKIINIFFQQFWEQLKSHYNCAFVVNMIQSVKGAVQAWEGGGCLPWLLFPRCSLRENPIFSKNFAPQYSPLKIAFDYYLYLISVIVIQAWY
jgi:hypothetical protein